MSVYRRVAQRKAWAGMRMASPRVKAVLEIVGSRCAARRRRVKRKSQPGKLFHSVNGDGSILAAGLALKSNFAARPSRCRSPLYEKGQQTASASKIEIVSAILTVCRNSDKRHSSFGKPGSAKAFARQRAIAEKLLLAIRLVGNGPLLEPQTRCAMPDGRFEYLPRSPGQDVQPCRR